MRFSSFLNIVSNHFLTPDEVAIVLSTKSLFQSLLKIFEQGSMILIQGMLQSTEGD